MGFKKNEIAGTTFVEILLALSIACLAAVGGLAMLAAANYQFAKARIESLVGGQIRVLQERLIGMPYLTLVNRVADSQRSSSFSEEGYFLEDPALQYPWRMDVRLDRLNPDSSADSTTVQMRFTWQEPAPGFPLSKNVTKTLICVPFQRGRF